jgi:hypothetical protein
MLSPTIWLQLTQETRKQIADAFGLVKSTGTTVTNGEVVCDGYTVKDLQEITLDKMKSFTKNESNDFYFQFTKVVNWFEGKGIEIKNEAIKPLEEITKKTHVKRTKSK